MIILWFENHKAVPHGSCPEVWTVNVITDWSLISLTCYLYNLGKVTFFPICLYIRENGNTCQCRLFTYYFTSLNPSLFIPFCNWDAERELCGPHFSNSFISWLPFSSANARHWWETERWEVGRKDHLPIFGCCQHLFNSTSQGSLQISASFILLVPVMPFQLSEHRVRALPLNL